MKKIFAYVFLPFCLVFSAVSYAMGSSGTSASAQDDSKSQAVEQAKKDYAVFLDQLKEISRQYGEVTGEAKKVIQEQGVPVWDDQSGGLKISHDVDFTSSSHDAFRETEKELKLILEAPGLKKESIRITIEDENLLRLKAVKKALESQGREEAFEKTYELPTRVSDKNMKASYVDGVLTVTLHKIPGSKKTVVVPLS